MSTGDEAWLSFWYEPWRQVAAGWLDDDWGQQWQQRVADDVLAARLLYPHWCQHFGWSASRPQLVSEWCRDYATAPAAVLEHALVLLGYTITAEAHLPWTNLDAQAVAQRRWAQQYRQLRPLPLAPADPASTPFSAGLRLLRQALTDAATPVWPRLRQRVARIHIDTLPTTPILKLEPPACRRLCQAALRQAERMTAHVEQ